MNIKILLPFVICALFFVSACSDYINNGATDDDEDSLDPSRNMQAPVDESDLNDKLGYVHYTRTDLDTNPKPTPNLTIDRNAMANMITRTIMQNPGFEEAATLVTDQEVLIAYQKTEEMDEEQAAKIAKTTAMSTMPRYFNIYVSDNNVLIKDIHSLHRSSTKNKSYDNTINRIIQEMKKSHQGTNQKEE